MSSGSPSFEGIVACTSSSLTAGKVYSFWSISLSLVRPELMPSSLRCDSGDIRVRLNAHSLWRRALLDEFSQIYGSDEAGFLNAFDANRDLIYKTAAKVHARGRKGSYELVTADF